jgi:hypothetical protein
MDLFAPKSVGNILSACEDEDVRVQPIFGRRDTAVVSVAARLLVLWFGAAAVCCLALRFFFPGYFDPLAPFHFDHYIYVGMHAEGYGPLRYIFYYPRPVAHILIDLCGRLGPRGLFVPLYALTWLNATLVVLYLERVTKSRVSWLGFLLFTALAYSNPEFYWNLKDDPFATFSLTFLLGIFHAWESYCHRDNRFYLVLIVVLALLLSLTKESYFVALALFLTIQALYRPQHRTAALSLLAVGIAFMGAAVYRASQLWTLFHGGPEPSNTYYTNLAPGSVWHGFLKIGKYLATPAVGPAVLVGLIQAARTDRRIFWLSLTGVLLGAASLLPNATLPNHLEAMYSFLGAYFFLAPLLFLDRLAPARLQFPVVVVVCGLALLSYRRPIREVAGWLREQEQIARRILPAIERARIETRDGDRSLVVGATMFYDPFLVPEFVLNEFGPKRFWTVVAPSGTPASRRYTTEVFGLGNPLPPQHYDHLFVFAFDGRLLASVGDPSPEIIDEQLGQVPARTEPVR